MNEKSCGFAINGLNPFTPESSKWHIDFTLSNARRFYSSKENPLEVKEFKSQQFKSSKTSQSLRVLGIPNYSSFLHYILQFSTSSLM